MIYLDNNSSTMMDFQVLEAMLPYFTSIYGNPSNINSITGSAACNAVADALYEIADYFNAISINDIIITSGATESNNLAISGILDNRVDSHVIISCIEHPSIIEVCKYWQAKGTEVTFLPVDLEGRVALKDLEKSIKKNTCLISVMSANNEIGTIQPIYSIAEIAKKHGVLFHTDASQYLLYYRIDVQKNPIDMISFSGHKMHGPKGIGGLYISKSARSLLAPIIRGGGQQLNLRSGTLNVPGIIGLSTAFRIARKTQVEMNKKMYHMMKVFFQRLDLDTNYHMNGSIDKRIPNNINMYFDNVSAKALIDLLPDIAISTGSACNSEKKASSYVLRSIGLTEKEIEYSFRIGMSKYTREEEMISVADSIKNAVYQIKKSV
jgi:cysteine desulfurase